ncbi:MAG: hypothetical protein WAK55_32875, partial [Xanthobacteraceae bacterium]
WRDRPRAGGAEESEASQRLRENAASRVGNVFPTVLRRSRRATELLKSLIAGLFKPLTVGSAQLFNRTRRAFHAEFLAPDEFFSLK